MCVGIRCLSQELAFHFRASGRRRSHHRMCDRNPSSSSSAAVERRRSRHSTAEEEEEEGGGGCTGKSCQSCAAGVIADCVAVCCCPCAVVNLLTLAFVKLPWAVARRCLGRRRRRRLEEERRKRGGGGGGGGEGKSEMVVSVGGGEELNDHFRAGFKGEDVWFELYELGHLGFGRVSFTGIPFQDKGD